MTARSVATIGSLALLCGSVACTNFYEIPIETPIQPKMDVSAFSRVLVAGFIGGGTDDVDANLETVRLLRSQLRTKSTLRVIDAEVLPLAEMARDQAKNGVDSPPVSPTADGQQPASPDQSLQIKNEADLKEYEQIFSDTEFWKKLAQDYDNPLIVTGSVLFVEVSKSGMVTRPRGVIDTVTGQETFRSAMEYSDLKGYSITPKFVFIDGRTGAEIYSETYHEETLYPAGQNTPALSSYFELMDKVLPSFLNTLSTQKIRGSRTLLK